MAGFGTNPNDKKTFDVSELMGSKENQRWARDAILTKMWSAPGAALLVGADNEAQGGLYGKGVDGSPSRVQRALGGVLDDLSNARVPGMRRSYERAGAGKTEGNSDATRPAQLNQSPATPRHWSEDESLDRLNAMAESGTIMRSGQNGEDEHPLFHKGEFANESGYRDYLATKNAYPVVVDGASVSENDVLRAKQGREVQAGVEGGTYTIKRGDNLSTYAGGNQDLIDQLVELNNIKNPDLIYEGAQLKLPKGYVMSPSGRLLNKTLEAI